MRVSHFPVTRPGQFIQIGCFNPSESALESIEMEWTPDIGMDSHQSELRSPTSLLRRPFSLAGRRDVAGGVELAIIHRVVGIGTDWLAKLSPGDNVSILGPLGNSFQLPPPGHTAILVGGGVGIPPMLYLSTALAGRPAVAFSGATTKDLLALTITGDSDANGVSPASCIAEFAEMRIPSIVTTDDGSYGFKGFITQALEKYLDANPSQPKTIYTCGPELMMKRVAEIAIARNIPCQVAVERAMACGMGTCQSCCIKVKKPDSSKVPLPGKEWCWRLACTDGPIFAAKDLLW